MASPRRRSDREAGPPPNARGSHRGCVSGSWTATKPSALPQGLVPSLKAATRYPIELLQNNMRFARNNGVACRLLTDIRS